MPDLKRREFISLLGGAAAAWPLAARAQQPTIPIVGLLSGRSPKTGLANEAAFRSGLAETGYLDGRNVAIQYRWAEGRYERQPTLLAELLAHQPAVIAVFNQAAAVAAKNLATTVPIVFGMSGDPVKLGLVASFDRPGGTMTGVSFLNTLLVPKQFEVLHELVPAPAATALLLNPTYTNASDVRAEAQRAAVMLGRQLVVAEAATENEIDLAFNMLAEQRIGALLVAPDPFFDSRREQIIGLAARHRLPAVYSSREFPPEGGLASYGSSISDAYRLGGIYAGKILKGEKAADLPVQQSVKVELVINLKTAKGLGLIMPTALLVRADEVIE
jgi:putative ABC transport system substrate-binding protein